MAKVKNPYFWIIGLGLLTYLWTVFFGFSYLDDNALILGNLSFLRNLANIPTAFTTQVFHALHTSAAYYRPLLTISFMLDSMFSGSSPFVYHLSNIAIHIATACVLFIFLQKINLKKDIALLFSLIFAVHPVLIQAVAWVPGRNDSLLALFSLASFIFILNYLETKKVRDLVWHLVFLAAAIFTKENGLLLAPMIFFYLLLFDRKKVSLDRMPVAFAWLFILGIWYLLRSIALQNPIKYTVSEALSSIQNGLPAILIDLGKIFLPINLSVLPIIQDSTLVWGILSFAALVVSLILSKKRNNSLILFGAVWFLVFLVPSFIRPDATYVPDFLEHRVYLPIVGLFIILSQIDFVKNFDFSSKNTLKIFGALVAIFLLINYIHTWVFRDKLSFWQSAVATSPHHPLAHKNLGAMYYLDGKLDKAEEEAIKSLDLNPDETLAHNNLGLIYMQRGEFDKAEAEYKKELEINPGYDNALFNYGLLLYREDKKDEAEKMWLETLKVNPDYVDAMRNLFVLYYQAGDKQKASLFYNDLQRRGVPVQ